MPRRVQPPRALLYNRRRMVLVMCGAVRARRRLLIDAGPSVSGSRERAAPSARCTPRRQPTDRTTVRPTDDHDDSDDYDGDTDDDDDDDCDALLRPRRSLRQPWRFLFYRRRRPTKLIITTSASTVATAWYLFRVPLLSFIYRDFTLFHPHFDPSTSSNSIVVAQNFRYSFLFITPRSRHPRRPNPSIIFASIPRALNSNIYLPWRPQMYSHTGDLESFDQLYRMLFCKSKHGCSYEEILGHLVYFSFSP